MKSEWDILCKGAIDTRMRTVVSRCLAIGLMFPNESTLVRMVALLYLARDQGEVRPDESYALLRDLKCMLKVMRKTCAKPADSIHIFPSTHTEFQEHYPRQYTHAYPREPPHSILSARGRLGRFVRAPAGPPHAQFLAQRGAPDCACCCCRPLRASSSGGNVVAAVATQSPGRSVT